MWQMTWDELGQEDVAPKPQHNPSGSIYYSCGICGEPVGIFGPKGFHEEGWIYKRDKCKNGHVVDWGNNDSKGILKTIQTINRAY